MNYAVRSAFAAVSAAFLSGLIACGGDDNPTGPGKIGKIGENDTSTASALAYGVVAPLLRDMLLETYINQAGTSPVPGATPTACQPLTICDSGSAEYCSDPGMLQVNFTMCALQSTSIDGSVSLSLGSGTGNGTFDLTVGGDFYLAGAVSYTDNSEGFSESFTNVVLSAGCDANGGSCSYVIDMTGYATWGNPRAMSGGIVVPHFANFDFDIPSLNKHVNVSVSTEPSPGFMQILIQNLNRTENQWLCEGNLAGSSLECSDPNY
jgi:hypothetical protein